MGAVEEKEGGGGKVGAWCKSYEHWLVENGRETRRASARLRKGNLKENRGPSYGRTERETDGGSGEKGAGKGMVGV